MKIPYALTAAMTVPKRNAQMAHAITLGFPRLKQVPIDDTRSLSIACYGPSLRETWQNLTRPIMSMSGATRWLAARGVIPDYHVDMDPRQNKVSDIDPAIGGVRYLMASVCCPDVFALLKGKDVTLWHTFSGKDQESGEDTYGWVARHDPQQLVVHGGSTIGLTALHLGGVLGYRHFEVHGMDGSFAGDDRHAGAHAGNVQKPAFTWAAEGVTYRTSKIMANAVAETINTVRNFPVFCVFHGEGLTQALIREENLRNACTVRETEKAERIRTARALSLETPPVAGSSVKSWWDALLAQPFAPAALTSVLQIAEQAEKVRHKARYDTGTVPVETALLLRLLALWYKPKVAAEVGTFIGTSARAIAWASSSCRLYTCDRSNNCLKDTGVEDYGIELFPFQESTDMFRALVARHVQVDFFFFDGRLKPEDIPLIEQLAHPNTVFTFDDCVGQEKGVANVALVMPKFVNHALVAPNKSFEGRSTLAALLPLSRP